MFQRAGKWLIVLALVFSTGGHWFALQSVAWLTMVVNLAQTESVSDALEKTFNGRHPCRLCKAVQEGRKSEQKQDVLKVEIKLEYCCALQSALLPPVPPAEHATAFPLWSSEHRNRPPTPPPRLT